MSEYELPDEWEITLDEASEKQAIIPNPDGGDPEAINVFEEFEDEYYVDLYHESIKPKMNKLIGSVKKKQFASRDEAIVCYERFARDYQELLSS